MAPALRDTRLLDSSENRVLRMVGNLKPRELTSAVLAYALAQAGSAELFAVLQRACMERCGQFPMEQASSLLWSFATVRLGPSFFREVQFDVLEGLAQLSVPAACDVLWSYCVVQHCEPHFFKALLSLLEPSRVAGDARCALLYPALLSIRSQFPDMDPEGLERYMGYASGAFRKSQAALAPPEPVLEGIGLALAAAGRKYELAADVDGYIVDALVAGPRQVAVLYHSPYRTVHPRLGRPLGSAMMRHRHLRDRGFHCVNLWSQTWDELPADDRVALVRSKLSASPSDVDLADGI